MKVRIAFTEGDRPERTFELFARLPELDEVMQIDGANLIVRKIAWSCTDNEIVPVIVVGKTRVETHRRPG